MASVSKVDYLKRYMSDGSDKKKKRKKKGPGGQIYDDDVDIKSLAPDEDEGRNMDEELAENAPTVADFVDERPIDVQQLEQYADKDKWKTIAVDKAEDGEIVSDKSDEEDNARKNDSEDDGHISSQSEASDDHHSHKSASDASPVKTKNHQTDEGASSKKSSAQNSPSHIPAVKEPGCEKEEQKPRPDVGGSDDSEEEGRIPDDSGSEGSPERRVRHNLGADHSPKAARRDSRSESEPSPSRADQSRRVRHDSDSDGRSEPLKRARQDSDSDGSSSDSDQPAPRRRKYSSSKPGKSVSPVPTKRSPTKRTAGSDSDSPPPRRRRPSSDSDHSPRRRRPAAASDSDPSPRRKRPASSSSSSDSDASPRRRRPAASDSDHSPRRKRPTSDSDPSPQRRRRVGSDSEHSPRRGRRPAASDSDESPRRRKPKTDPAKSPPPRAYRRHSSDSDLSPQRRKGGKADPSRHPNHSSALSKNRRAPRDDSDSDLSPPRPGQRRGSPPAGRPSVDGKGRPQKTLSGVKAGLSTADDMRREARHMRYREDKMFRQLDTSVSGRDAETVVRDRSTGRRRDLKQEQMKKNEEQKKKEIKDQKYAEWGKGLKQKAQQEQAVQDTMHELDKPLARYKDDKDLDQMMREQDRAGDPMLAFIKKKKKPEKEGKERPRYKGPAPPPNRMGMMPGYRWDGVDRSNGFENQIFTKAAEKKATAAMAYKWSTEDM